jgi:hypothetical protein
VTIFIAEMLGPRRVGARRALVAGHLYSVWDDRPYLLVGFEDQADAQLSERCAQSQHLEPHKPGEHGPCPRGSERWWLLCPLAASRNSIGYERRYGRVDVEFTAPISASFACVVHPRKYFTPATFRRMLDEIRDHYGWSIEWDASEHPVHSGTFAVGGEEDDAQLLTSVRQELQGARQWLRMFGSGTQASAALVPEARLVAAWHVRRMKVLRTQTQRQEAFLASAAMGHGGRSISVRRRNEVREQFEASRALLYELMGFTEGQPLASGPFALSPHMQRDHRLRRLLHAFAPTSRERWAEVTGEALSSSPPLKAADVFEYWCTAVLAFAARTRGWTLESKTGRQDRPDGGVPVSHRSAFRSDDARFTIWFQPDIASTSPSGLQSMDVRMRQGIDVAAAQSGIADGLVAYGDETPDFALLLELGDGRRAFAIGDAALSDPDRRGGGDKVERMIRYRDRVAWRVGGKTLRCHPGATFVMLPGAQETWDRALANTPCDSIVLCADPAADPDLAVAGRFAALMELLERVAE